MSPQSWHRAMLLTCQCSSLLLQQLHHLLQPVFERAADLVDKVSAACEIRLRPQCPAQMVT